MSCLKGRLLAVLAFVLAFAVSSKAHAGTGIGAEGGLALPVWNGEGVPIMLGFTLKTDKIPLIMGGRMQLDGGQVSSGGAFVDLWLDDIQIGYSIFNFYYGPGFTILYNNELEKDGDFKQHKGLFLGPRFFAGISTMLSSFAEMYMQTTLEPGIVFDERDGFLFRVNFPVSLGFRFWF